MMNSRLSHSQIVNAFSSRRLNLILFPTEKCNFRCTYCYESFDLGRMQSGVVASIKALIDRRVNDLDVLEVGWFGGEPLLAKDIVLDLSEYIMQRVRPGLIYRSDMTTNGYLLDVDTAASMISRGVTFFQISLDGFGAEHDKTRRRADGCGTYQRIWNNLLALRELDLSFEVMLRVHFSPTNIAVLDELIQAINRDFAQDSRFTVFFKSIEKLSNGNDVKLATFSQSEKERIETSLEQQLDSMKSKRHNSEQYICYASMPNSLIVRADGSLGKCTVALYDERNRVGHLRPDGLIDVEQPRLHRWLRGFSNLQAQDLACPYSSMKEESLAGAEPLVSLRLPAERHHRVDG